MRGLRTVGLAACLFLMTAVAHAQSSLGIGSAEVSSAPSGPFAGLFVHILAVQRAFFVDLRQALVAIRDGQGGLGWLVGLSFVYGVFHAAGPGHGKAVISSYMLANEAQLRRGVVLSFASALLQGASALAIVALGWFFLRGTALSMTDVAWGLEIASYAMVALIGLWLLSRKLRSAVPRIVRSVANLVPASRRAPDGLAFAGRGTFSDVAPSRPRSVRQASMGYGAEICDGPAGDACDCGRPHIADPRQLAQARFDWRAGLSTVLAVGLRPCSGAIVVLTFSIMNGLALAGGLSVLAMALGTAITVSLIASLAVMAKGLTVRAGRLAGRSRPVVGVLEIVGAGLLVLLGSGLFLASLPG